MDLKEYSEKSLDCCKWSVKNNSDEDTEDDKTRKELKCLRDWLRGHDQNVDRNVDSKSHADKVSHANEEDSMENWTECYSC